MLLYKLKILCGIFPALHHSAAVHHIVKNLPITYKRSYIMKDYQKPELEVISLTIEDVITAGDGVIGGEVGNESSIF